MLFLNLFSGSATIYKIILESNREDKSKLPLLHVEWGVRVPLSFTGIRSCLRPSLPPSVSFQLENRKLDRQEEGSTWDTFVSPLFSVSKVVPAFNSISYGSRQHTHATFNNEMIMISTYTSYLETAKKIASLLEKFPPHRKVLEGIDVNLIRFRV